MGSHPIQQAAGTRWPSVKHLRVDDRCFDVTMASQFLDGSKPRMGTSYSPAWIWSSPLFVAESVQSVVALLFYIAGWNALRATCADARVPHPSIRCGLPQAGDADV